MTSREKTIADARDAEVRAAEVIKARLDSLNVAICEACALGLEVEFRAEPVRCDRAASGRHSKLEARVLRVLD